MWCAVALRRPCLKCGHSKLALHQLNVSSQRISRMSKSTSSLKSNSESDGKGKPVRLMMDTKVSTGGGPDALFNECLDQIRRQRAELELDHVYKDVETGAVTKLKEDELALTRRIFRTVDPTRDVPMDRELEKHHIDPYWDPYHKVRSLKDQVTAEFDEYSRIVSVAEQKRVRIQIKRSLRRNRPIYNPYSREFRRQHGRKASEPMPVPFHMPDMFWERTPLQEKLERETITWRDVDIIQHFMADNGYILPRRTTKLSRRKQRDLVRAMQTAQCMALIPYKWKVNDFMAMPLMDPLQWMADRLTDRVVEHRDKRSRAMIRVMMEKYPELDYGSFLKHEAERKIQEETTSQG